MAAKLKVLQDQAKGAGERAKAQIERRIADLKANRDLRSRKLSQTKPPPSPTSVEACPAKNGKRFCEKDMLKQEVERDDRSKKVIPLWRPAIAMCEAPSSKETSNARSPV
jgi:hypothetical protein